MYTKAVVPSRRGALSRNSRRPSCSRERRSVGGRGSGPFVPAPRDHQAWIRVAACKLNPSTSAHRRPMTKASRSAGAPRTRTMRRPRRGPVATDPPTQAEVMLPAPARLPRSAAAPHPARRSASGARPTDTAAATCATSSSGGAASDGNAFGRRGMCKPCPGTRCGNGNSHRAPN